MSHYQFEKLSERIYLHGDTATAFIVEDFSASTESVSEQAYTSNTQQSFSSSAIASGDSGHDTPHPDDPVRGNEHVALLNLVPHSQVTHRAASDGPWSDPATWEDRLLPGDLAHVLIPHDIAVVVDGEIDARLATIRVDGILGFATAVDTSLTVDTFVIAVEGTLQIGTSQQPIAADVSVNILFTDDGPIDTVWDPTLLSRGLISHGNATIHGAAKTGPINLAVAPNEGDTVLELDESAEGWKVGDRVLVPGIDKPIDNNKGITLLDEDEIVVITAISADGTQITLDQQLQYDHIPPRQQLDIPIANLDRNINFSSENKTDPQRAGHVMFMHSPNATVNYAAFDHIGRNDKSIETTDPQIDGNGVLIPSTGLNPRGRYGVHFHRIGSESAAASVVGSVVANNPGWGFVNHDSNVIFRENVSYNIKGAGFVSEIGSERGAFISNLAVRSRGKNFYQPQGASDKGEGTGFGSVGHGFWLQSASVALIDNVAAGHAQEGIFIHSRTVIEPSRDMPTYVSLIDTPAGTPIDFAPGANEPTIRDGEIRPDQAPLIEISGNKVFASGAGMGVRWRRHTSALAEDSQGDLIENFEIWNVEWAGVHLGYSSGLTLRNGMILGDTDDPIGLGKNEKNDRETETRENHSAVGRGITANRNSRDLRLQNLQVAGFTVGIQALTQGHTLIDTAVLQNVENLLIVTPQATEQSDDMRRIDAKHIFNLPLPPSALGGATPYNVRLIKQIDRSPVAGGSTASQEWDAFTASDEIYYNGHRLYFYDQGSDAIPFSSEEAPSFMNEPSYQDYLDQTNQQLLDKFGLALGNEVAPPEAFDAANSLGAAALAVHLDEVPELPKRIEFGFNVESAPTHWALDDTDAELHWRTKGLSPTSGWRIYLDGELGIQEVARSGQPTEYAQIVAGTTENGWQTWDLMWPVVGHIPAPWPGTVTVGEHSIIAVSDDGSAVYLGRITIAESQIAPDTGGAGTFSLRVLNSRTNNGVTVVEPNADSTRSIRIRTLHSPTDRSSYLAAVDKVHSVKQRSRAESIEEVEQEEEDELTPVALDQFFDDESLTAAG